MTLKRSVLSLLLILTMLFAIPASAGRNVLAATEKIDNITIDSKGILQWNGISNLDSVYYVSFQNHQYLVKTTRFALYDTFNDNGYKSGTYTVSVSCRDTSGTRYYGSISYNYVSPYKQFPSVKNIRISGDNLTWDYDTSAAKGATPYFHITVKGPNSTETFVMQKNLLPKGSFALNGTYDYTVSIQVKCKGFINSEVVTKKITGISASLPTVTGFTYSHGVLSWNKIPGADAYSISIEFSTSSKQHYGFDLAKPSNYVCLGQEIARTYPNVLDNNTTYDMKVTVCGLSDDDINKTRMSNEASYACAYKYEEYPIKVYGETLSSKKDIRDLLGDGEVEYLPDSNELVFKGKSIKGQTEYVKDKTMFTATGDLRISGSADINANYTIINAAGSVYFKTNSSFNAHSRYTPVVVADSVAFEPGGNHTFTSDSNVFNINNNVVFINNVSYVSFKTSNENRKAINISKGKIVIPKTLDIVVPSEGRLSDDKKNILNKDGTNASEVIITKAAPTATPMPTPTTAPTAKPSAAPTVAPSVAPTVAPTANPVSMPTSEPTVAPTGSAAKPTGKATATPAPDATAAPTTKVTTAPKPTSEEVSPADPNAQILAFVERIYIYVLDREPEAEGAAFWSEELYSFRRTGAEVAQGFIFSDEFAARNTTDEEFVTILYKTFFGRDPEEDGMNFWLDQLATGAMDRTTVANGFIYSQEWADTCASYGIRSGGDLKPSGSIEPTDLTYAFVERMYTTAMGRGYDEEGKQYWASELANFNITGEQCGASFFLSDEMTGYGLSDEEFLGRLYATFMNREADEDGAAYWLGIMASGTTRADVVFGFTRSAEFTDKCIEARILPY